MCVCVCVCVCVVSVFLVGYLSFEIIKYVWLDVVCFTSSILLYVYVPTSKTNGRVTFRKPFGKICLKACVFTALCIFTGGGGLLKIDVDCLCNVANVSVWLEIPMSANALNSVHCRWGANVDSPWYCGCRLFAAVTRPLDAVRVSLRNSRKPEIVINVAKLTFGIWRTDGREGGRRRQLLPNGMRGEQRFDCIYHAIFAMLIRRRYRCTWIFQSFRFFTQIGKFFLCY